MSSNSSSFFVMVGFPQWPERDGDSTSLYITGVGGTFSIKGSIGLGARLQG